MTSALRAVLRAIQPAGVILFARNITGAQQTYELLETCQAAVERPLFRCVDLEGGTVDRLRDVIGRALDRELVKDQIYGGVVQGLGRALGEELVYDDTGQLRTASFADYGLPTGDQVPPIDIELIEVPSEQGALGSRGIGEPPIVPGLAAVANAIADATGVRLTAAPFTPEAMLEALKARAPAPARI